MPRKKTLFIRLLSSTLLLAFAAQEVASAAPAFSPVAAAPSLSRLVEDPLTFEAPFDFASVKDVHRGANKKLIIHLQDAHANLSGQKNLASSMDEIMRRYAISTVLVEGAEGDAGLETFKRALPIGTIKLSAKKYLMEGNVAGEEYLNLISDHPMEIIGVEDLRLYMKSVARYADLADKRGETLDYLKQIRFAIDRLKTSLYPSDLADYENNARERDGLLEASLEGLAVLGVSRQTDFAAYPSLRALLELKEKEKTIDFNHANLEQAALITEIANRGGRADVEKGLATLGKSDRYAQMGFIRKIKELAAVRNIVYENYPNLLRYLGYLEDFSRIDLEAVIRESSQAEDAIYAKALPSRDAKLLRSVDRYVKLLETAYRIQMTTAEFALFKANEPDFATPDCLAFLNRKLAENGLFGDWIEYKPLLEEGERSLVEFYDSVNRRDLAFIENAEKTLETQDAAFLIAGGYHTPHLKTLFEKKGWSYIVLTPVVTTETNQQKYEKLLLAPVRKEVRRVETVSGESRIDKSLSALEKDLIRVRERKNGVKLLGLMFQGPESVAERLAEGGADPRSLSYREALESARRNNKKLFEATRTLAAARLTAPDDKPLPDLPAEKNNSTRNFKEKKYYSFKEFTEAIFLKFLQSTIAGLSLNYLASFYLLEKIYTTDFSTNHFYSASYFMAISISIMLLLEPFQIIFHEYGHYIAIKILHTFKNPFFIIGKDRIGVSSDIIFNNQTKIGFRPLLVTAMGPLVDTALSMVIGVTIYSILGFWESVPFVAGLGAAQFRQIVYWSGDIDDILKNLRLWMTKFISYEEFQLRLALFKDSRVNITILNSSGVVSEFRSVWVSADQFSGGGLDVEIREPTASGLDLKTGFGYFKNRKNGIKILVFDRAAASDVGNAGLRDGARLATPVDFRLPQVLPDDFFILMPTHNENEYAEIDQYISKVDANGYLDHVIWVDDGSTDGTAQKLAARERVFYLGYADNQQKEGALESAVKFLKERYKSAGKKFPEYFVAIDADTFYDAKGEESLIQKLNQSIAKLRAQKAHAQSLDIRANLGSGFPGLSKWMQAVDWALLGPQWMFRWMPQWMGRLLRIYPSIPGGLQSIRQRLF